MKTFYSTNTTLQLVRAAVILLGLASSTKISAQTITTFDAPGAGTGGRKGTYVLDIDQSGRTIGFFRDANDVRHGYIRSKDGNFTIFRADVTVPHIVGVAKESYGPPRLVDVQNIGAFTSACACAWCVKSGYRLGGYFGGRSQTEQDDCRPHKLKSRVCRVECFHTP